MIKIVVDMMGGDNGIEATLGGVRDFHAKRPDVSLILVGDEEALKGETYAKIIGAKDVMKMESGVMEVLHAKESSMVKAIQAVVDEKADGVLSCGSTGAFLIASSLIIKKIEGVERPALTVQFPHVYRKEFITLLDVGASNLNTPSEMAQFAFMGTLYSKATGVKDPKVALLSNGAEAGKGSPEGQEAYKLISADKRINFIGNMEASDVLPGKEDVVVTDGYSGNVFMKTTEGTAKAVASLIKKAFKRSFASKIGYLFAHKGFDGMKDTLNPKTVGGAMLLGVNAVAVKAHGNSDSFAFYHALELTYKLASNDIVNKIKEGMKNG